MDLAGFQNILREGQKKFGRHKEANLFLVLALCFGIAMACINPPFQECDGWMHYLWATDVSYGNLLRPIASLPHRNGVAVVPKNVNEFEYRITEPDTGEGGEYIRYLKNVKVSPETIEMKLIDVPSSLFYYPQALGLLLGRVFHMSVYWGVVLSRICNLLVFIALAFLAIRISPILKNTLAVVGLFPLSLYQAASDSPDAMLNGLCFLFTALCFSYAYGERERLYLKDVCKLSVVLGLIFLSKYVYACLGLLVFLIPMKKFGGRKEYWRCFALGLLPFLFLGGIGVSGALSVMSAGHAAAGDAGGSQLQYLVGSPLSVPRVLIDTFMSKFNDWMLWLNTLGNLNYPLGPLIYIVPMYAVYVGCQDRVAACDNIRKKDKWLCLAAFILTCLGVVMGLYIGDGNINEVGAKVVQGVQGRYFIAVLPVFFVIISQNGIKNKVRYFTEKSIGIMGLFLLYAVYSLCGHCL